LVDRITAEALAWNARMYFALGAPQGAQPERIIGLYASRDGGGSLDVNTVLDLPWVVFEGAVARRHPMLWMSAEPPASACLGADWNGRVALVSLSGKAPFVEWINAADPVPANATVTFEDAREEPTAGPRR
jgi:hypothetical protein